MLHVHQVSCISMRMSSNLPSVIDELLVLVVLCRDKLSGWVDAVQLLGGVVHGPRVIDHSCVMRAMPFGCVVTSAASTSRSSSSRLSLSLPLSGSSSAGAMGCNCGVGYYFTPASSGTSASCAACPAGMADTHVEAYGGHLIIR